MQHAGPNDGLVQGLMTSALPALADAMLKRLSIKDTDREALNGQLCIALAKPALSKDAVGAMIRACCHVGTVDAQLAPQTVREEEGSEAGEASDATASGGGSTYDWVAFTLAVVPILLASTPTMRPISALLEAILRHVLSAVLGMRPEDTQRLVGVLHLERLTETQLCPIIVSRGSTSSQLSNLAKALLANCSAEELATSLEASKSAAHKACEASMQTYLPNLTGQHPAIMKELMDGCAHALLQQIKSLCDPIAKPSEDLAIISLLAAAPHAVPSILFDLMLRVARQVAGEQAQHVRDVLRDMFRARLAEYGVQQKDMDKVFLALQDVLNEELLVDPLKLAHAVFALRKQEDVSEAAVDCARAVTAHWIIERLQQRSFDRRIVWVVREAVELMPVDEVANALLRDPEALLNNVLRRASEAGVELAQELLEDSLARAQDLATQKLVELGVSPEYAETIAEHAQSLLVEGVEALTTQMSTKKTHESTKHTLSLIHI